MRKDKPCVLKVEDITMQFGGVVAVNNFSMEEYEGVCGGVGTWRWQFLRWLDEKPL